MALPKWPLVIVSFCSVILPLPGQTNDWGSVKKLAPRTTISVVRHGRQNCRLLRVTDSALDCACWIGNVNREYEFTREQVREVRLEEPEQNRMIAGAIIGGVVGGLVGYVAGRQTSDPEGRGYARIYSIPVGALLGGAIGRNFHRHGAVIYRR